MVTNDKMPSESEGNTLKTAGNRRDAILELRREFTYLNGTIRVNRVEAFRYHLK
jgi:hypothetical protein